MLPSNLGLEVSILLVTKIVMESILSYSLKHQYLEKNNSGVLLLSEP